MALKVENSSNHQPSAGRETGLPSSLFFFSTTFIRLQPPSSYGLMVFRMFCPWCRKEKKPDPSFESWEAAKAHLKEHGANKKQMRQGKRAWESEMWMANNPYEAYAGCSELEAVL